MTVLFVQERGFWYEQGWRFLTQATPYEVLCTVCVEWSNARHWLGAPRRCPRCGAVVKHNKGEPLYKHFPWRVPRYTSIKWKTTKNGKQVTERVPVCQDCANFACLLTEPKGWFWAEKDGTAHFVRYKGPKIIPACEEDDDAETAR